MYDNLRRKSKLIHEYKKLQLHLLAGTVLVTMETLAVVVLITYTGAWPLELKLGLGRIFVALPTLDIGIIFIPAGIKQNWYHYVSVSVRTSQSRLISSPRYLCVCVRACLKIQSITNITVFT